MPEKPRVKAPKQRVTHKPKDADRQRRMLMYGGGALVVLAAVFLLVVVLGLGGGEPSPGEVREKVKAAGGTMRTVDALPGDHTLQADEKGDWNTDPPTSGEHFGFDNNQTLGTTIWGAWEEPLQLARVVHNLEHGGIFIFYGDKVRDPVVTQLRGFYEDHQNGTLLAPYPKLGNKIALGAWVSDDEGNEKAYLAKLTKFDEDAFSDFFSAFQFKGPERFPEESLLPGQS
jgi:Protein of unknown function (DUF3105)